MSLLQTRDVTGFFAVFAVCVGSSILLHNVTNSNTLFSAPISSAPIFQSSLAVASRPYVFPRSQIHAPGSDVLQLTPQTLEDFTSSSSEFAASNSSLHSVGISALFASALLAAAGIMIKMSSSVRPQSMLHPMEMLSVEDVVMAASTSEKRAAKKAMKKKKPAKKKEEKKEREAVVYTPKEVMKRMHAAAAKRALLKTKKEMKTRGRICQLLRKVDNRKARTISFSHIRTKRVQKVNLHWKRFFWEEANVHVRLRLSTKGIKTITRYGLQAAAIKFGLDLTKHLNGVSKRKYNKYLPESEKKFALLRGARLRYRSAVRWARLNDEPLPPAPKGVKPVMVRIKKPAEQAAVAMAISHGVKTARLGRPADQRKALLRSLTTELIRHGRIKTTVVKAKAMRKFVDHMITLAKENTLHTRRQAAAYLYDKALVKTLFEQVPERYGDRNGGYTRITRISKLRKGDAAPMCFIELV